MIVPGSGHFRKFCWTLTKLKLGDLHNSFIGETSVFCERYSKKGVVLVGSNPSSKSPDDSAFHINTKSRKFVDKWFDDSWCVAYDNLVNFKTEDNKQLSVSQIKKSLCDIESTMDNYIITGYKIVACGKTAALGLEMAGVEFFEMPHPSGLCRFWNDKEAGEAKVEEMKTWIQT